MQMLEIETKARVEEPEELRQRLEERGELMRRYHKRDIYFRVSDGPNIRVRREDDGSGSVTRKYKQIDGGIETSREDEFTVDKPELVEQLLLDLGAVEYIRKEKIGHAYRLEGLTVELSEVIGLGHFVEIEWVGPDAGEKAREAARSQITALAASLGIPSDRFESRTYTEMLLSGHSRQQ
ncbi:MAG: class IV adenylate cyclase [Spirochaeta sp.]